MKTISVSASRNYDVLVGHGLLASCGSAIRTVCGKSRMAAIVSDDTVWGLYGQVLSQSLQAAGLEVVSHVFPHGESSKNILEYAKILNFLAESRLSRTDLVVALGGGVVGDMAGFAAATYLRGIPFVQVPTTLLAAVDSSVGGKTAIDLPAGKNLAGAFYQPELVLCDLDTLKTLPAEIFRDGCAEVVKYAVLDASQLLPLLQQELTAESLEEIVSICIEMKRDMVAADEFDFGQRQYLNLGHTFGHGVEASSRYTLSHGKAVAIGLAMMARAARKMGYCSEKAVAGIEDLLHRFDLPTACPYPADMVLGAMLADKKISGQRINLIVPEALGLCRILPVQVEELGQWLTAGGAL